MQYGLLTIRLMPPSTVFELSKTKNALAAESASGLVLTMRFSFTQKPRSPIGYKRPSYLETMLARKKSRGVDGPHLKFQKI